MNDTARRPVRRVSELCRELKRTLADDFEDCWVEGELSGLRPHASGHWYFTLKDGEAQLKAAMFARDNRRIRFAPRDGDQVLVRGRVDLYEPRGDLQLIVSHMEPRGQGALLAEFERLKARLAAEGLFAPERKRPLPFLPRRIGIVTSESGAALHDMLSVLGQRDPGLSITIAPARVQGAGAAASIAAALELLGAHGQVEVILCGRGGGSLEDLWAFNEEAVVRALAACPVPVISCVGHETDITLADFAADVRAPTPTAAAEMVVPDRAGLVVELTDLSERLDHAFRRATRLRRERVELLRARLLSPQRRLDRDQQRLDDLRERLQHAATRRLHDRSRRVENLGLRLGAQGPGRRILSEQQRSAALSSRLLPALLRTMGKRRASSEALRRQLLTLGPLASLERGYAIVRDQGGAVVRNASDLGVGQRIEVVLHRGSAIAEVQSVEPLSRLGEAP